MLLTRILAAGRAYGVTRAALGVSTMPDAIDTHIPPPGDVGGAPPIVLSLVKRFTEHLDVYRSGAYNETELRRDFLDPFFGLDGLGWDIANVNGASEAYRPVVHEDRIKVGGSTKAPDYSFRIGGVRKFFVEAKKPAVDVKTDIDPAYQLRRYAWSAKLPLSILTDFEELSVYDCRMKPEPGQSAGIGRVLYFHYTEYVKRWGELHGLFSPTAITRGAFDRFAESTKAKRGTAEVDDEFLTDLETWRAQLARNIALRNPGLSVRELNEAVQQTLDRIVFLRICEDRGIEPYGDLMALLNGTQVYARLGQLFRRADERYDSGLFHFSQERGRSGLADTWTLDLSIDDSTLKGIIKRLYYPDSPYEFSVISGDILGQVYERFLGKVIRLTAGGRAKVEEKPEVRKAGGVYYTPTFVVDHIVRNTVGRLLEGKTPSDASKLKILDPACGSGSFLIGAFQYLLDWHTEWYTRNRPERHQKEIRPTEGGWRLTTSEKKRILTNNIFGVDIDPQAVEVTKLSLLLKVLEGETEETVGGQLRLFHERALPDLGANIQCGNSLIGTDVYAGQQLSMLDDEAQARINAFDWNRAFPEIMARGGFDAVIGNPPYVRIQAMKEWAPVEVEIYKQRYRAASKGNYDIYVVFVEKGLSLLNSRGRLGFILPHKFFNAQYGGALRSVIAEGRHLAEVVHFGHQQVFEEATTYTCLLFLDKGGADAVRFSKVDDLGEWRLQGIATTGDIPSARVTAAEWNFNVGRGADLFEKLRQMPVKLRHVTDRIFQGIKTSCDRIYIVEELDRSLDGVLVFSRQREREYWLDPALLHPLVKGGDSRRYSLSRSNLLLLFPYADMGTGQVRLVSEAYLRSALPRTYEYLVDNKADLEGRERGRMKGPKWYGYIYPKALDVMSRPKLFTPDIALRPSFSMDSTGEFFFTGGVAGGYGILVHPTYTSERALGILNSSVLGWFHRRVASQMRGGYYSYESRFISELPLPGLDPNSASDVTRHEELVALVHRILDLHTRLAETKSSHDKEQIQRRIEATDREIDQLVYRLYDLTSDEIAIVEAER